MTKKDIEIWSLRIGAAAVSVVSALVFGVRFYRGYLYDTTSSIAVSVAVYLAGVVLAAYVCELISTTKKARWNSIMLMLAFVAFVVLFVFERAADNYVMQHKREETLVVAEKMDANNEVMSNPALIGRLETMRLLREKISDLQRQDKKLEADGSAARHRTEMRRYARMLEIQDSLYQAEKTAVAAAVTARYERIRSAGMQTNMLGWAFAKFPSLAVAAASLGLVLIAAYISALRNQNTNDRETPVFDAPAGNGFVPQLGSQVGSASDALRQIVSELKNNGAGLSLNDVLKNVDDPNYFERGNKRAAADWLYYRELVGEYDKNSRGGDLAYAIRHSGWRKSNKAVLWRNVQKAREFKRNNTPEAVAEEVAKLELKWGFRRDESQRNAETESVTAF